MTAPTADAIALGNGLTLAVERYGRLTDSAVLLITGLGTPMRLWPNLFCRGLAEAGYSVVAFDNRDCGLSSHLDELPTPSLLQLTQQLVQRQPHFSPYSLDDMANDAVLLMDALAIDKAHVIGISMGGMIAQLLTGYHGDRVLSLTSMMSSASPPSLPELRLLLPFFQLLPSKGFTQSDSFIHWLKQINGQRFDYDEDELRWRVAASVQQGGHRWPSLLRQLAAVMAAPSRVALLHTIQHHSLVIHGDQDPLVPLAAGVETAKALLNSRFVCIEGMGHTLSTAAVQPWLDNIVPHLHATSGR